MPLILPRVHVTFGLSLDSPHFVGPLPVASLDAPVVGPKRFLALLETQLGLAAPEPPHALRLAQLSVALRATPSPHWHASVTDDPLGTARRLLDDYDALRLHGWNPQAAPRRLADLAAACQNVAPGLPDRLRRVIAALHRAPARVARITLADSPDSLPALWQLLLAALQVPVDLLPPSSAFDAGGAISTDLDAVNRRRGPLRGDGTVQLFRPSARGVGAEHVAAFIDAVGTERVCVVTPDATLDAALARRGLPTHGCSADAGDGAMQLIPLIVDLAYSPADPATVVQWLTTRPNPLPSQVCQNLLRAMQQWPAVGSPAWLAAAPIEVESLRVFNRLFTARLQRVTQGYPLTELLERCQLLHSFFDGLPMPPRAAQRAVTELMQAAQAMGTAQLPQGQVSQLVTLCMQSAAPPPHPAEAGAQHSAASGMLAAVPFVVWWDCVSEVAPAVQPLRVSFAEASELRAQGMTWPTSRTLAREQALAWRRPVQAATEAFIAVAPRRSSSGESCSPHPLWDEVLAQAPRSERTAIAAQLTVPRPQHPRMAPMSAQAARIQPVPAGSLQLTRRGLRREGPESPSSLELRLGCSFRWAVHYLADVRDDGLPSIDANPAIVGSLAHELLASIVGDTALNSDAAAQQIAHNLDTVGPQHVAALYLPRGAGQRQQLRRNLESTTRLFVRLRDAHGFGVQTEVERERLVDGVLLRGRIDVLLSNPDAVIDFKSGGSTKHFNKLRDNTAAQLAAYSYMVQPADAPLPAVGYFILHRAELLTTADLSMGFAVPGAQTQIMWDGLRAALSQSETLVGRGQVQAPGTDESFSATRAHARIDAEGVLRVPPPCDYCSFAALCRKVP